MWYAVPRTPDSDAQANGSSRRDLLGLPVFWRFGVRYLRQRICSHPRPSRDTSVAAASGFASHRSVTLLLLLRGRELRRVHDSLRLSRRGSPAQAAYMRAVLASAFAYGERHAGH